MSGKKFVKCRIYDHENMVWSQYCADHPIMQAAKSCFDNVSPSHFWSVSKQFPDLVNPIFNGGG